MKPKDEETRCGFVAIVGRPNVGKSTLLNRLVGEKLSITSRKPQTTRHKLLGVKTTELVQIIYVDTPGMHLHETHQMNRYMNKAARRALIDVDVVIFVVDALKWTEEDNLVLEILSKVKVPVILAINKADTVSDKKELLPHLKILSEKRNFTDIIPLSAKRGTNIALLEQKIIAWLPVSPHYFDATQVTDQTIRFRIAELIREKLVRLLGQELPYETTVEIESVKKTDKIISVSAIIWVAREGQKPIVIGQGGERLKEIGIRARADIEKMLGEKLHLKLWVKIKKGWSDDERALKSLGYFDKEPPHASH